MKNDSSETDSIRLLLSCILTDPNKFNELSKQLNEKQNGNEKLSDNQIYLGLFDIWMNSQLLNFDNNKN